MVSPAPMAVMTLPVPEPNVVSRSPGAAWGEPGAERQRRKHSTEQTSRENPPIEFLTNATVYCYRRRLRGACSGTAITVGLILGACRALGVESENRPQRGQFLPTLQRHSGLWAQKAVNNPLRSICSRRPKSDRLRRRWVRLTKRLVVGSESYGNGFSA